MTMYIFEKWESPRMRGEAEKLEVKDTFKGLKQKNFMWLVIRHGDN